MNEPKKTVLFNQLNGSDKEYHVILRGEGAPAADLWMVDIKYGPRGNCNRPGSKTKSALPHDQALKIYNKIVTEQLSSGYTLAEGGTAYEDVPEKNFTGVLPQLLNPIGDSQRNALFDDPNWCMQPKYDGERVMIRVDGDKAVGINRTGVQRPLPQDLAARLAASSVRALLDGELVAGHFHAFDVVELNGRDLRDLGYEQRLRSLCDIRSQIEGPDLDVVTTAATPAAKRDMRTRLYQAGQEGVVWKRLNSRYITGRPATGGDQLKDKFVESCTVEVSAGPAGKRSVGMTLYEGGQPVNVGNVTIPPNAAIPVVGSIVEVQYLYAFKAPGSLFQPVYKGPRTDQARDACTTAQLKYKGEATPVIQDEAELEQATPRARARA